MAKKNKSEVIERPRFVGIGMASDKLGVCRGHLRKVLLGQRESRRLMLEVRRRFPGLVIKKVG